MSTSPLPRQLGIAVTDRGDCGVIVATGAGVDALYRGYLKFYGPKDGATQEVFAAIAQGEFRDELDGHEALSVSDVLYDMGLRRAARTLRQIEARDRADELRDQAAAIEAEADKIEWEAAAL